MIDGAPTDTTRLLSNVAVTADTTKNLTPTTFTLSGAVSFDGQTIPDTYNGYQERWPARRCGAGRPSHPR